MVRTCFLLTCVYFDPGSNRSWLLQCWHFNKKKITSINMSLCPFLLLKSTNQKNNEVPPRESLMISSVVQVQSWNLSSFITSSRCGGRPAGFGGEDFSALMGHPWWWWSRDREQFRSYFEARWWFQKLVFFFIPTWGEMIQFDEYFSDGLKTHQPEKRCHKSSSQSWIWFWQMI